MGRLPRLGAFAVALVALAVPASGQLYGPRENALLRAELGALPAGTTIRLGGAAFTVNGAGRFAFAAPLMVDGANDVLISSAASGAAPTIAAEGVDADVGLTLATKGAGRVNIPALSAANPALNGTVSVTGGVRFDNAAVPKIHMYDDGISVSYGIGLNDFESAYYAGPGAAHRFRVGEGGTVAPVVAAITATGLNATPVGTDTPAAGRFTTLALTGSQTSKFVLIAPNAAAGAPTWRQILAGDVSGLGTLATANAATPPALGTTTPAAGTFTALAATGYSYRSGAAGLSAAGTTQATGTAITKSIAVFTTVASGAGGTLPNVPPVSGAFAEFVIVNAGANALLLYPASGLSINALAANAALSVAAGATVRGVQHTTTNYRFN